MKDLLNNLMTMNMIREMELDDVREYLDNGYSLEDAIDSAGIIGGLDDDELEELGIDPDDD